MEKGIPSPLPAPERGLGETTGADRKAKDPWNRDRAVGQMKPFEPDEAQHIRMVLDQAARKTPARARDLALFNLALDAMCRSNELLSLRVRDVTDHLGQVTEEFEIIQSKTGRTKTISLGKYARRSLQAWIDQSGKDPEDYLWTSIGNRRSKGPLSRMQFSRLVKDWASIARADPRRYSTHSLRRTKSTLIYEETKNLRACQLLLGHKSIGSTAEYLGIDRRDALRIAKKITI
ncbi:MAG: tyrosine-type recombinase/integrase [Pseudomonadota bacterium]